MSSVRSKATLQDESMHILEIRQKIQDDKYMNGAIYRIAMILSDKLMEDEEGIERK